MLRGRKRRSALLLSALTVALGSAASRCMVYDTSLLVEDAGPPLGQGIGWWSKKLGNGCFSASYPRDQQRPRPQPAGDVGPIYLAISSMRLGGVGLDGAPSETAWQDIGLDLDEVCSLSGTCPGNDFAPEVSCKSTGSRIGFDGNACRDNSFGRLEVVATKIPEVAVRYGLSDDAFNCALCVGAYNFLIRITGYNGTANDDELRIDMYPSPGLDKILEWDCRPGGDWRSHPCFWESNERPLNVMDSVLAGPATDGTLPPSRLFDDQAYVRDGYFVLTLPQDTLFAFPGKQALATAFPLRLKTGLVTGKLGKDKNGAWSVTDGTLAGRTLSSEIIRSFRLIGFCEDDRNYKNMTEFLTTNLDVLADGTNDPSRTCDGLSVGLGFTGTQVQPGRPVPVEPLTECAATADAGSGDAAPE